MCHCHLLEHSRSYTLSSMMPKKRNSGTRMSRLPKNIGVVVQRLLYAGHRTILVPDMAKLLEEAARRSRGGSSEQNMIVVSFVSTVTTYVHLTCVCSDPRLFRPQHSRCGTWVFASLCQWLRKVHRHMSQRRHMARDDPGYA